MRGRSLPCFLACLLPPSCPRLLPASLPPSFPPSLLSIPHSLPSIHPSNKPTNRPSFHRAPVLDNDTASAVWDTASRSVTTQPILPSVNAIAIVCPCCLSLCSLSEWSVVHVAVRPGGCGVSVQQGGRRRQQRLHTYWRLHPWLYPARLSACPPTHPSACLPPSFLPLPPSPLSPLGPPSCRL